ncbi:MAG: C-terminal binding protein, partial [Oscillospiraceae bacterium]|nr:C-terminal binding protein [Oscillospiraceae bacterium]
SNIRSGTWDYVKTVPIHRFSCLTIGIIGLGRIGKQYAKRANAFGFRIIASDDRAFDVPDYVTMVPFETLLEQSDVVSLNCPRNNNIDLVSDREFSMMKKGACIINVSRGGLINEDALERALSSGKIAGAGIDVVSSEPMPRDHPLLKHDNVSISPHMAWYSEESFLELCSKVAEEAVRFVRGEELCYPVNKIQICNRYYDFKFNKNKERS